jgi:hypothetical protein
MVRDLMSFEVTSWSQAATYQAFSGCGRIFAVVVDEAVAAVMDLQSEVST